MKTYSKISLLFLSTLVIPGVVAAQSATPSPSTSPIRDSVREKVAEELAQIKNQTSPKGFVGTITAKSDATITIATLKNQTRTATIVADTTIKLSGGKDGTPADLKVGDFILAMGDADGQNNLTTKRLLVIAKPTEDKRRALWATVTTKTATTLTVETKEKEAWTIKLSSTTKFTGKTKASDILAGDKIVVIGTPGTDNSLTPKLIHEIPSQ